MDAITKILARIEELGLSQDEVERATGLPDGRLSKWKARGEPSVTQAAKLARFLNLPLEYLGTDAEGMPQKPEPLASDESLALELYRDIRAESGEVAALKALTRLAEGRTALAPPSLKIDAKRDRDRDTSDDRRDREDQRGPQAKSRRKGGVGNDKGADSDDPIRSGR